MDSLRVNVLNQNGTIHLELEEIQLANLEHTYNGIEPLLELIVLMLEQHEGVREEAAEDAGDGVWYNYMYDLILVRNHEDIRKVRAKRFDDVIDAFRTLIE